MWLHQAFIVCGVRDVLWALLGTGCARDRLRHLTQWQKKALLLSATPNLSKIEKGKNFKPLSSVGRAYILLKDLIYHLYFNAFLPQ